MTELDVENAGTCQETMDDFKEVDKRLWQVLIAYTKREAKNFVCNPRRE